MKLIDKSPILEINQKFTNICIMAPGPSLTEEQVTMVMQHPDMFTIVIGDAHLYNPFADILYHCDKNWWSYYSFVPEFKGCLKVSYEDTGAPNVHRLLPTNQREGLCLEAPKVVTGSNSGYQALNLAVHYKPKKIILIGYDMQRGKDGRYNIIGDHPRKVKKSGSFPRFIRNFQTLVKPLGDLGIQVYNCSIDTALNCFQREELKNVL